MNELVVSFIARFGDVLSPALVDGVCNFGMTFGFVDRSICSTVDTEVEGLVQQVILDGTFISNVELIFVNANDFICPRLGL